MSSVSWWANWLSGLVCLALAINFFAMAYGLRLGGKPLDITTLPKYEPRVQDGSTPPMPLAR